MPRDRHQNGWVEETGKRVKNWKGHFYVYVKQPDGTERRKHRAVILGPKSGLRKWEAEQALGRSIERETGGNKPARPDGTATFGWFVRERYLPMRAPGWRDSTRMTNLGIFNHQILPTFENLRFCDVDKFTLQSYLNELATKFSHSVVDHARTFLKSVFDEAVEMDFIEKNPARRIGNPETRKPVRRVLTLEQLRALLGSLAERYRLIVGIASLCALRPGELFALKWKCFEGDRLYIRESVYRGKMGETKTEASAAPVALPASLVAELERWRAKCVDTSPEALIFPTHKGTAILKENFMRRVLKPAGKKAGCGFVTFQVLRRTFATLAHDAGASLKDVQAQLRHSHVSTTAEVYTQPIPESVRAAVEALNERLMVEPVTRKLQ